MNFQENIAGILYFHFVNGYEVNPSEPETKLTNCQKVAIFSKYGDFPDKTGRILKYFSTMVELIHMKQDRGKGKSQKSGQVFSSKSS